MNTTEAPEKLYVNVDEFANQGEGIFVAGDLRMFVADVEYLKATSVQPELDRLRRENEELKNEIELLSAALRGGSLLMASLRKRMEEGKELLAEVLVSFQNDYDQELLQRIDVFLTRKEPT